LSRIGKLPIAVPKSVKVTLAPGHVKVEGPKGQLERTLPADITIKQSDGELVFERPSEDVRHRAMHGLVRSLVANMSKASRRASPRTWSWSASATAWPSRGRSWC